MKIILILYMCSMNTGACLPPYEWPVEFKDAYECSIAGYEESARKLREIGREEVNQHRISITFACQEIATT